MSDKTKSKIDKKIVENDFSQKKINHIVHYLDNFEVLLKILKDGFAPSYCLENIIESDYYIPMVSFCNIPLKDVDQYMRYGKYGLGMSLDWALKNRISPVVYIHESTPFKDFSKKLFNGGLYKDDIKKFDVILEAITPAIQFFKNWKTTYKGKEIITYHEREWRYIPDLEDNKVLDPDEFNQMKASSFKKKPHLPEYSINFNIEDIRYIVINSENQRNRVINSLMKKYDNNLVIESILSGKLMIINDELIRNDF